MSRIVTRAALAAAATLTLLGGIAHAKDVELLNVSYDPTRELYEEYNKSFAAYWQKKTGDKVTIKQSHGGSGKQARSVIDGLQADVVTLALAGDIDAHRQTASCCRPNWQTRLPHNSTPYTSTIVFLVRKGNPKGIKDWGDLVKPGVAVITPNPKTSGGARWNYLAAWGWALKQHGGNEARRRTYRAASCSRTCRCWIPARAARPRPLCSAASAMCCWRGRTKPSWRSRNSARDKFEIVVPSVSILAEPPVAVVDKNVDRHGTRAVAEAYLEYLYTDEGQECCGPQLLPAEQAGNPGEVRQGFPEDQDAGDHRRLRRLDEGAGACTSRMAACSTRSMCRRPEIKGTRMNLTFLTRSISIAALSLVRIARACAGERSFRRDSRKQGHVEDGHSFACSVRSIARQARAIADRRCSSSR